VLVFLKPERLHAPAWPSAHAQARDPKTMSASSVVVGIDVAKAQVDVAVLGAKLEAQRFDNQAEAHSALAAALKPLDVALVVMEATGGYETELACALQAAGLPVAVINPRQARDFDVLAHALAHEAAVICVDVAGRGHSDWLEDPMAYHIPTYVNDLAAVLAHLGLQTGQVTRLEDLQRLLAERVTPADLERFCGPGSEWKCEFYLLGVCQRGYERLRERFARSPGGGL
jgi:transposase